MCAPRAHDGHRHGEGNGHSTQAPSRGSCGHQVASVVRKVVRRRIR
jgi:hypothetical protein